MAAQHLVLDQGAALVGDLDPADRIETLRQNISTRAPGMLANLEGMTRCPEVGTDW